MIDELINHFYIFVATCMINFNRLPYVINIYFF